MDGSWSDAARWTAGVPEPADVACITAAGTYTVALGDFVGTEVAALIVGGASGTQTLTSRGYITAGSAEVRPNGRVQLLDITPGGEDGLYTSGTVTVEGEVTVPSGVSFLRTGGTLDVAPGGTLRVVGNGVSAGSPAASFRIRGTLEATGCPLVSQSGSCVVSAPLEVLGGTVRAAEGVLFLSGGGTIRDAVLDASATGTLVFTTNQMTVEGLVQGNPQGTVGMAGFSLYAGPAGATLAVGGTGFQMVGTSFLRSGGGAFTNTGLLLKAATGSNFSGLADVIVRNEGVVEIPASLGLYAGSVLRNEPGGIVRATAGGRMAGDGNGTGRFDNAGLFVLDAPGQSFGFGDGGFGRNAGPYSQPGSEIRVLAGTLDLTGPGGRTLPAGAALTGTGSVSVPGSYQPEGAVSPGTAEQPLARLTHGAYFYPSLVAGGPRLVIDVAAGGRSDTLDVGFAPGGSGARLAGSLVVRVAPGYTPAVGDAFTILQVAGQITGQFDQIAADGLPDGLAFVTEISGDQRSLLLRAVAASPGGALSVSTTTPVGGAVRSVFLNGPGAPSVSAARLDCRTCLDPAAFGTISAQISRADGLTAARFDLTSPRAFGFYDLVLQRPGQPDEVVPVTVRPYLAYAVIEGGLQRGIRVRPEGFGYNSTWYRMNVRTNVDAPAFALPRLYRADSALVSLAIASTNVPGGFVYETDQAPNPLRAPLAVGSLFPGVASTLHVGLRMDPEDVLFPEQTPSGPDDPRIPFGEPREMLAVGAQHLSADRAIAVVREALTSSGDAALTGYAAAVEQANPAAVASALGQVGTGQTFFTAAPTFLEQLIVGLSTTVPPPPGLAESAGYAFERALDRAAFAYYVEIEHAHIEALRSGPAEVSALFDAESRALFPEGFPGDDGPEARQQNLFQRFLCFLGFGPSITSINNQVDDPFGDGSGPPSAGGGAGGGSCQPPSAPIDPNDKTADPTLACAFGTVVVDGEEQTRCVRHFVSRAEAQEPVQYGISFENQATATAPAEFVTITDEIDPAFDLGSLQIEGTSSDSTFSYSVSGRTVTFRFTGIGLPPNVSPPEGEGYVRFSLRPTAGLPDGTEIRNDADIVFDFNPPIATPEVIHEIRALADVATLITAPDFVTEGTPLQFEVLVANLRGDPAEQVVVTIDAGTPAVSVTPTAGSCSGSGPVTCSFDGLAAGASERVAVSLGTPPLGLYTLSARAATASFDGFAANDADAVTAGVVGVAVEENPALPQALTLAPPFPNPTRAAATLRWGLPGDANVSIHVYDLLGRTVAVLADGTPAGAGWHETRWDAQVAAGVYVVRLQAGREARTRRVLVTR